MADANGVDNVAAEEASQAANTKTKGKKPKPARAKKPRKQKPAKEAKAKKTGKKEKPAGQKKPGLVIAIIIIALVAVVGVMYYYNIFQLKSKVVGFFISQDSQYQTAIASGEEYKAKMEELNQRQLELADKEKQLADKEANLAQAEEALQSSSQDMSSSATVDGEAGTSRIVQMYENMSTDDAVEILNRTADNGWIADLLSQMDEKKAAKILAGMDVDKAIAITRLMSS